MNDEYMNQDLKNPKYFFHGSPLLLKEIETRLSHDSDNNISNIDNAVFVTPSFKIASAYAFKDRVKKDSEGLDWDFKIASDEQFPIMTMSNVRIDENMFGYIYVFLNDGSFINQPYGSLQYKSFSHVIPINVVKIYYKDYKNLYGIENTPKIK
jgi:hypothetical protein